MRADTALVEVERDRIVDMYRKKINEETFEKRKQLKEQKLNMNRVPSEFIFFSCIRATFKRFYIYVVYLESIR